MLTTKNIETKLDELTKAIHTLIALLALHTVESQSQDNSAYIERRVRDILAQDDK